MHNNTFYALAMYYLHEILLFCGTGNSIDPFYIKNDYVQYIYKGGKLNNRNIRKFIQQFKRTETSEIIIHYLTENSISDIFMNLQNKSIYQKNNMINNMKNILLILSGKNTTVLDMDLFTIMVNGQIQNEILDKLALHTSAGILYKKLHKCRELVPYNQYNLDVENINAYLFINNIPHNLIREVFSFEQISSAITKYRISTNILHWPRMSPLYAAVIRRDKRSPIRRMTLDALGIVLLKLN